ncbi:MAG: ABC transporter ATP-binding protein, partial [Meiothermus sp.]|nr:ABC transporter ATP-binding protein [Meiothermus sp.]
MVLLHQGRIVAEGSVGAIKNRVGLKQLRLRASSLPRLTGVARLEQSGDTFTLHTPDADALVRELVRKEVDFSGLE